MNNIEKFYKIEEANNLFDLRDRRGVYVWDVVRYCCAYNVFINVEQYNQKQGHLPFSVFLKSIIKKFAVDIKSLFVRKETLFYLTSRNNINGHLIDKGASSIFREFDPKEKMIVECFGTAPKEYEKLIAFYPLNSQWFSFLISIPKKQLNNIYQLLKKEFPQTEFSYSEMVNSYKRFIFDRAVYRFFLRLWRVKRMFITQNSNPKGLYAAAKELNIPIYEMQHGIVDIDHPSYSYPNCANGSNCYMPDKIFSFSPYWFQGFHVPHSKIIPVGCDSFYVEKKDSKQTNTMLVVSCLVRGEGMSDFVLECLKDDFWKQYHIFYKLHPNEFYILSHYQKKFQSYPNVELICNEKDIPTLARLSDIIVTYKSTVVFETLQMGVFTCILNKYSAGIESMLKEHYDNLRLIDEPEQAKQMLINSNKSVDSPVFFANFNRDAFLAEIV